MVYVIKNYINSAGQFGAGNAFPLFPYPEPSGQYALGEATQRTPNFNQEIIQEIAAKVGLAFVNEPEEKDENATTLAPIDVLDYNYAVLHSPTYREKYREV